MQKIVVSTLAISLLLPLLVSCGSKDSNEQRLSGVCLEAYNLKIESLKNSMPSEKFERVKKQEKAIFSMMPTEQCQNMANSIKNAPLVFN